MITAIEMPVVTKIFLAGFLTNYTLFPLTVCNSLDKCPFSESKSWVNDLIDLDVIRDWTCSMADKNSTTNYPEEPPSRN
jgi:hypothetical protein